MWWMLAFALAEEPYLDRMPPHAYNNLILSSLERLSVHGDRRVVALQLDGGDVAERTVATYRKDLAEARATLTRSPSYRGANDLQQAGLAAVDAWEKLLGKDVVELLALTYDETPSRAELESLSRKQVEVAQKARKIDEEIRSAQRAFAKKHRFELVVRAGQRAPGFVFRAPGLTPEGVEVSDGVMMGLALSYLNQHRGLANRLIHAVNPCLEVDPRADSGGHTEATTALTEALELVSVELASADPSFVNGPGLHDAVKALLRDLSVVRDRLVEFGEVGKTGATKRPNAVRFNALTDEINATFATATKAYKASEASWTSGLPIEAYNDAFDAFQAGVDAPAFLGREVPEGFVDLAALGIEVEVRYATDDNFTGAPLAGYGWPGAWMTKGSGEALGRVDAALKQEGLALRVYDAYRPARASQAMVAWADREDRRDLLRDGYIAAKSGHNKGHTVDLTLVSIETGEPLDMGSAYDHFGPESHTKNASGPEVAKNRESLVTAMFAEGFRNYSKEWWHFSHPPGPKEARDVPYACAEPLVFTPPAENSGKAWKATSGPCVKP